MQDEAIAKRRVEELKHAIADTLNKIAWGLDHLRFEYEQMEFDSDDAVHIQDVCRELISALETLMNWGKEKGERNKVNDNVNHPSHYCSHPSGIDCIQVTEHYDFCTGNAIKYLWRAGLKQDSMMSDKQKQIEDLRKAVWYIEREIGKLEK